MAPAEPISPELVLVCPELREALQAGGADRAGRPSTEFESAGENVAPSVSEPTEEAAIPDPRGRTPVIRAAAVYAASRVLSTAVEATVIIAVLVLAILAATQLLHL